MYCLASIMFSLNNDTCFHSTGYALCVCEASAPEQLLHLQPKKLVGAPAREKALV